MSFSFWLRQRLLEAIRRAHRLHLGAEAGRCSKSGSAGWMPAILGSMGRTILPIRQPRPRTMSLCMEAFRLLHDSLGQLREIDREVLLLYFFEGLSYREIGIILCLEPDAVKSRQHRASQRLASVMRANQIDWCHDAFPRTD